jgi:CHAT domain-containing protein
MAKCLLLESQINSFGVPTQNIVENLQASLKQLSAAADLVIMEQWLFPEKTPHLAVFDRAINVAQQLGEILKDKSFEETAFHFAQMAKTISLRQSSIPQLLPVWEDQSATSWNIFMDWREAVLSYRAKPGATDDLKKANEAWSAQVDRKDKAQIEHLIFGESHKKLSDIQTALSPTDQVAVYHTGKYFVYLFSITKSSFELKKIDPIQEVSVNKKSRNIYLFPSIEKFKAAIDNNNRSAFEEYGTQLYQQLVKPMSNTLEGKTNLIVIADHPISTIPFDALIKPSKKRKRKSLKKLAFLIKDYQVSYLLSTDQLFSPKQAFTNGGWILSAPNLVDRNLLIDYEGLFDTAYQTAPQWALLGENNMTIPAHPKAKRLVEAIGSLPKVEIINEIEALTKRLENASIWQIESQTLTHPHAPNLASIIVTDEFEEGWLIFVNEFVQKENGLSLIIFNELSTPQEQFLLPLLVFSTNHILSPVKEDQFLFLEKLHEQISSAQNVKDAIRNSKLELLKKNKTAHPMKWAGIQLYGK